MSINKKEGGGETLIIQDPVRVGGRGSKVLLDAQTGSCHQGVSTEKARSPGPGSRSHMDQGSLTCPQHSLTPEKDARGVGPQGSAVWENSCLRS